MSCNAIMESDGVYAIADDSSNLLVSVRLNKRWGRQDKHPGRYHPEIVCHDQLKGLQMRERSRPHPKLCAITVLVKSLAIITMAPKEASTQMTARRICDLS